MEKERDQLTETILGLTLRIIYLLTGGECVIEQKTGGSSTTGNCHVSGNVGKTQSTIKEPSSHSRRNGIKNYQKILELTNKMIHLLTGEVSIRCQNVAVYFSLEEWDYLEGHKDMYQDVLTDNLWLFTSLGHKNIEETPEEPVTSDSSPESSNFSFTSELSKYILNPSILLKNEHEESISCDENEDSLNTDTYTDYRQQYSSRTLNVEVVGYEEGDIIDADIYIPVDHAAQSPFTSITGNSSEEQNHGDIDIITIPDDSLTQIEVTGKYNWSHIVKPIHSDNLYDKVFPSSVQTPHNRDHKYNGSLR
ncbi:C2H2 type [Pristimantis euphronides]